MTGHSRILQQAAQLPGGSFTLDHQSYCLSSLNNLTTYRPAQPQSSSASSQLNYHLHHLINRAQHNSNHSTQNNNHSIMPVLTRECLAHKLRQNWLAKHPADGGGTQVTPLDDSLTSLNWLQNLNIMKITTPTPPSSPTLQDGLSPMLNQYTPQTQVNPNAVLNMGNVLIKEEPGSPRPGSPMNIFRIQNPMMEVAPPILTNSNLAIHEKIDYSTNPYVKPPYSYATLICMAMKETKKNKITLAGIYTWITENFMYYRHADPSWQNSIRHNLSLNKCFQKVPRRKDEPGKGGFWRINPEYEDMFINGIFKKRRATTTPPATPLPPFKKLKSTPNNPNEEDSNSSLSDESNDTSPMLNCTLGLNIPRSTNIIIKTEPKDHHHSAAVTDVFPTPPTENISELDFNWNSLLTQDIEVGGVKIKTEDLLGEGSAVDEDSDLASPITTMSPPPSDSNSDVAIEDLLTNPDFFTAEFDNPTDFDNGQPLDLSISGISLKPPEWWVDSISESKGFFSPTHHPSGLNTPSVHDGSDHTEAQNAAAVLGASLSNHTHPWAEDDMPFDTDITNLFDIDNLPSPKP